MVANCSLGLLDPEMRCSRVPIASTTPVSKKAAETTKKPAMVMTAGSLNPESASCAREDARARKRQEHQDGDEVDVERLGDEEDHRH